MEIEVAIAAAACSALIFELASESAYEEVDVKASDNYPARWNYDGQYHDAPKAGSNSYADYLFSIMWKPIKQLTPTYDDLWDLDGFVARVFVPNVEGVVSTPALSPKVLDLIYNGRGAYGGGGS